MYRREKVDWLFLLLSIYLLAIVGFIFTTHFDAIQAGHPAYEILLVVVAILSIVGLWRSLFRLRLYLKLCPFAKFCFLLIRLTFVTMSLRRIQRVSRVVFFSMAEEERYGSSLCLKYLQSPIKREGSAKQQQPSISQPISRRRDARCCWSIWTHRRILPAGSAS